MTNKIINIESYNTLVYVGHVVPRGKAYFDQDSGFWNSIIPFTVGKEYTVTCADNKKPITVRCTQDCPYSLKVLE